MTDTLVEIQYYEVTETEVKLIRVDPHDSENCLLCRMMKKS